MTDCAARMKIETISDNEPKLTKICHGTVSEENGGFVLRYVEEASEFQKTKTKVTLKDDYMSILRTGSFNNKLEFRLGELIEAYYETPFGQIQIETDTSEIKMVYEEHKNIIRYDIKYRLMMGGTKNELSNKDVSILVKIMER